MASLYIDAEIAYINFAFDIQLADTRCASRENPTTNSHKLIIVYIFRITLLIALSVSLRKYAIYDIYNNAFTHGGRLNVTFDRYFIVDANNGGHLTESRIQQMSKYVNRRNLSDITMRLGIIESDLIPIVRQREWLFVSLFQLPRTAARNDSKSVLSYLLTDNDTIVDTQPRHAANVISIVAEMLRCKYDEKVFIKYTSWVECADRSVHDSGQSIASNLWLSIVFCFVWIFGPQQSHSGHNHTREIHSHRTEFN